MEANLTNLIGECRQLILMMTLTAHVAHCVFTRYMLFAMEQRQNEDQRTGREVVLAFLHRLKMADITFNRSTGIVKPLMASLRKS